MAETLLSEYRTLARLWAQSPASLERLLGRNSPVADMLIAARAAMLEAMRSEVAGRAITPADPKLIRYLQASMGALPHEILRALFLDGSRRVIGDEQMQHGTIGQLTVHARVIFRRALELNAAGVILVHNHPSGDPTPSRGDIDVTERLVSIGYALDVHLLEHIVVTSNNYSLILHRRTRPQRQSSERLRDSASDPNESGLALANARRSARRRLLRRQLVGADELFGEPAWEILLDLFIHECEGKPVSVSSASIASGLAATSAQRLLQRLCDAGLLVREADREDGRRTNIRLSPELAHRLMAYFAASED
jgi:DNA repair protein RadC